MVINVLVLIVAFLVRLIGLNQSLWLDEGTTAKVVKQFDYFDIIKKFSPSDFHPPLYYLFMKLWTNIFGYSEISLRMPSIIFSILTGIIIYKIGKLLGNKRIGFWAMVFFLFNPLITYYSQEARMYMMVTLFLVITFYYLINLQSILNIKNQKSNIHIKYQIFSNVILFNLFLLLSFVTFYGSVFLIGAVFIYLLIKKQYKIFFASCLMFLVTFLVITPLLVKQLSNSKEALRVVTNWSLVLGKANLKNLILIPVKFAFGRISFYPKIIYYSIAGIWTGFVFYFVIKGGLRKKLLAFLFIIPLFLGFIFSLASPLLQYFRFLYLLPLMCLLMSFASSKNWQRWLLTAGFLTLSLVYLLGSKFHREDWKELAKDLPNDKNAYIIVSSSDALKYYSSNLKLRELKNLGSDIKIEKNIIVIPYTSDIHGVDYKKILKEQNFALVKKISLRELTYEEWSK